MQILEQRTRDLYEEVKKEIESGKLKTVDEIAVAITKGADERSIIFGTMKDVAAFTIMGAIDSESLYQMVEVR